MNSSCNDAEPAHRRGAATRAQVPALLKGLIYGPNGRPMSPSHTRRRGRIYRYCVTREAIADGYESCAVTSVPGADVEGAVLDHVQKLLAAPELVARTWSTIERAPTSASWINAVETFFARLTQRRLKRGVFHSLVDLQAAINRYLAEHNTKPKAVCLDRRPRSHHRRGQARVPSVGCDPLASCCAHDHGRQEFTHG